MGRFTNAMRAARLALQGKAIPFQGTTAGYDGGAFTPLIPGLGPFIGPLQEKINYAVEIGDPLRGSLIMAAVRWLGRTLHEPDLYVSVRDDQGKEIDREVNHPAVQLLQRPNDYYGGSLLMKAFAASWIPAGKSYLLKRRNSFGQPIELWYEPHFTIRERWPQDGSEFIGYYEVKRNGRWLRVERQDVVPFKDGLDPVNLRDGLSGLPALLASLFTDQQRESFAAWTLKNVGMVPFVVSPRFEGQTIDETKLETIQDRIMSKISGKNRGKPLLTGGAIRVDKLGLNPSEMDLTALARIPEERVAAVIGINAFVLGFGAALERSIYNNMSEARKEAYESYLLPLQSYMCDELTTHLLRELDPRENVVFAYDYSRVRALAEDQDKLFLRWGTAYKNGIVMRSEAKKGIGLEAKPEDEIYAPVGNAQALPEPPANQPKPPIKMLPPDVADAGRKFMRDYAPKQLHGILERPRLNGSHL